MQKEFFSKLPKSVVFAADVGGTNTVVALCSVTKNKVAIHVKYSFESQKITKFEDAVREVLKDSKVRVKRGCIAAAGLITGKVCKLTNTKWSVDVRKLPFKCKLINDFEALGYSINVLQPKDYKIIRKGKFDTPIALIGAGTGLGKAVLKYENKLLTPIASEGGHGDLPVSLQEIDLLAWSKRNLQYEDVLSGRGLVYLFKFAMTGYDGSGTSLPSEIMREDSEAAEHARKLFVKLYARCAKNFVLDTLSNSVIIGGGIAAKNANLFGKDFLAEFQRNDTYKVMLSKIPIKIITNVDAGLIGAGLFATF